MRDAAELEAARAESVVTLEQDDLAWAEADRIESASTRGAFELARRSREPLAVAMDHDGDRRTESGHPSGN